MNNQYSSGETEASPEDDGAPQISLHRCAHIPSFSASSRLRGTHAALTHRGDNAAILCREDDIDQVKESNTCLLKAMGQSSVQTPSEPYFKLFGHHHQQARTQVRQSLGGIWCYCCRFFGLYRVFISKKNGVFVIISTSLDNSF